MTPYGGQREHTLLLKDVWPHVPHSMPLRHAGFPHDRVNSDATNMHLRWLSAILALLLVPAAGTPAETPAGVLLCRLQEPCWPCQPHQRSDAHCRATGHSELLTCSESSESHSSTRDGEIRLALPLQTASMTGWQHGSQWLVARGCRDDVWIEDEPEPVASHHHGAEMNHIGPGPSSTHTTAAASVQDTLASGLSGTVRRLVQRSLLSSKHKVEKEEEHTEEVNVTQLTVEDIAGLGGHAQLSLLSFELIMLSILGVALPVVYWRKIRVHYL